MIRRGRRAVALNGFAEGVVVIGGGLGARGHVHETDDVAVAVVANCALVFSLQVWFFR